MNSMTIALLALAAFLAIAVVVMTIRNHRRHGQFGCPIGNAQTPTATSFGMSCDSSQPRSADPKSKASSCGCRL